MSFKYKIGFIGGGNMANAIINGLVDCGVVSCDKILVSDPFGPLVQKKVDVVSDNMIAFQQCEFLVLSVKPQIFKAIKAELKGIKSQYIVSIMAGISASEIASALPISAKVVRVMPNTPCKVGRGMTCVAVNDAGEYANAMVDQMFGGISKIKRIDESLFHAVTSISGSGPAYAFMFIKALATAGIEGGLDADTAKLLAVETVLGAGMMVTADMTSHIDDMIAAVCSKGGTTIEAVRVFEVGGLGKLVSDAVKACRDRSEELGRL